MSRQIGHAPHAGEILNSFRDDDAPLDVVRFRAMRRRLFTIAACASLLLFVGTSILWVRSAYASDWFLRASARSDFAFISDHGRVGIWYEKWRAPIVPQSSQLQFNASPEMSMDAPPHLTPTDLQWGGFSFQSGDSVGAEFRFINARFEFRQFAAPMWFPTVTLFVLPAAWLLQAIWHSRHYVGFVPIQR